jgi:hypothetical protein
LFFQIFYWAQAKIDGKKLVKKSGLSAHWGAGKNRREKVGEEVGVISRQKSTGKGW